MKQREFGRMYHPDRCPDGGPNDNILGDINCALDWLRDRFLPFVEYLDSLHEHRERQYRWRKFEEYVVAQEEEEEESVVDEEEEEEEESVVDEEEDEEEEESVVDEEEEEEEEESVDEDEFYDFFA